MDIESLANALEPTVDRHGIAAVLGAIGYLCAAKAEHIETTWQDRQLARAWKKVGGRAAALAAVAAKQRL
jgi:hypothetical protein